MEVATPSAAVGDPVSRMDFPPFADVSWLPQYFAIPVQALFACAVIVAVFLPVQCKKSTRSTKPVSRKGSKAKSSRTPQASSAPGATSTVTDKSTPGGKAAHGPMRTPRVPPPTPAQTPMLGEKRKKPPEKPASKTDKNKPVRSAKMREDQTQSPVSKRKGKQISSVMLGLSGKGKGKSKKNKEPSLEVQKTQRNSLMPAMSDNTEKTTSIPQLFTVDRTQPTHSIKIADDEDTNENVEELPLDPNNSDRPF